MVRKGVLLQWEDPGSSVLVSPGVHFIYVRLTEKREVLVLSSM